MARRALKLKIVGNPPEGWTPHPGPIPKTRGDCPTSRPCVYVTCRMHCWYQAGGTFGDRAGKRWENGAAPPSRIRAQGPSCVLDIVEANPHGMDTKAIAKAISTRSHRTVELVLVRATAKLRHTPGISADWIEALEAMHPRGNGK